MRYPRTASYIVSIVASWHTSNKENDLLLTNFCINVSKSLEISSNTKRQSLCQRKNLQNQVTCLTVLQNIIYWKYQKCQILQHYKTYTHRMLNEWNNKGFLIIWNVQYWWTVHGTTTLIWINHTYSSQQKEFFFNNLYMYLWILCIRIIFHLMFV